MEGYNAFQNQVYLDVLKANFPAEFAEYEILMAKPAGETSDSDLAKIRLIQERALAMDQFSMFPWWESSDPRIICHFQLLESPFNKVRLVNDRQLAAAISKVLERDFLPTFLLRIPSSLDMLKKQIQNALRMDFDFQNYLDKVYGTIIPWQRETSRW